jgi:hypothetical protein
MKTTGFGRDNAVGWFMIMRHSQKIVDIFRLVRYKAFS